MASVTYDHVYKRFGDVVAVNDLNIHIEDKEFLVFVGPSGCGKTTSLPLAGLEEISDGNILIGDRVVNDVPPKDRDIAMVFQSYALYPHMSVYDNMAFGLKLRKTPKADIERRVKEAASILDIEHLLDRKPKQLSGGQRQRVAVGRQSCASRPSFSRRAAFQPGRQAACPDARPAHPAAPAPRHDLHLRDARPGRGHDDGEPHCGHERTACCSRLIRRSTSMTTRTTCSLPVSSAPKHELLRCHPHRERWQVGDQRRWFPPGSAGGEGQGMAAVQGPRGHLRHPSGRHPAKDFVPPGIMEADVSSHIEVTEFDGQ